MEIKQKFIKYNYGNRNGKTIDYIVIHDVGKVSSALENAKYFNSRPNIGASADFFVDANNIIQTVDYTKHFSYHCGDGKGVYGIRNNNSIGIEMCLSKNPEDFEKTLQNTLWLVHRLCEELNISPYKVVRHYDASGKLCPRSLSTNNWERWEWFRNQVLGIKEVEDIVEKMIYNYIDKNMPEWAREPVQWLVDKGVIKGTGEGLNLDDQDLQMAAYMKRLRDVIMEDVKQLIKQVG